MSLAVRTVAKEEENHMEMNPAFPLLLANPKTGTVRPCIFPTAFPTLRNANLRAW